MRPNRNRLGALARFAELGSGKFVLYCVHSAVQRRSRATKLSSPVAHHWKWPTKHLDVESIDATVIDYRGGYDDYLTRENAVLAAAQASQRKGSRRG